MTTEWTKGVPAQMGDGEDVTISVRYNGAYKEIQITNGDGVGIGMTLENAGEFVKQMLETILKAGTE